MAADSSETEKSGDEKTGQQKQPNEPEKKSTTSQKAATPLTPQILQTIVEFMGRVDLKGREVPSFNQCMVALASTMQIEQAKERLPSLVD